MEPADLRAQPGPHVFVENLDRPELGDADHHHLTKALRLRPGDPLTLSDGGGNWCPARLGAGSVEWCGPVVAVAPPRWPLALACALTKGAKPDLVVQKATEIGIDRVVFFGGEHSVPVWDLAKRAKATTRLSRIAREAAMQSRQVRVPVVAVVDDLAAVVAGEAAPLARADFGGRAVDHSLRTIVIGPEGGWSATEQAQVETAVDLGPSVLRAETAAIVAATLLQTARVQGTDE